MKIWFVESTTHYLHMVMIFGAHILTIFFSMAMLCGEDCYRYEKGHMILSVLA